MKTLVFAAISMLLAAATGRSAPETNMELTSGDFPAGGPIPPRFTCDGANDNPSLRISGAPEGTKSLALIVTDPDAPRGTFTHWIVTNIPTDVREFTAGSVPNGVTQSTNDFGKVGYGGPCPPSGEHRYFFRLYALDTDLKVSSRAHRAEVEAAMKGHVLAEATLMGRYARNR